MDLFMLALLLLHVSSARAASAVSESTAGPSLLFVSEPSNDFLVAARAGTGASVKTFATTELAVAAASAGDGLLLMAEAMLPSNPQKPQNGTGVTVTAAQWAAIQAKKLVVYIEFPSHLPGSATALPVAQTLFERVVVSPNASKLDKSLQAYELLHPHKHVDYAVLPTSLLPNAQLVLAKVAGYDTACFGLPGSNQSHPFLTEVSPTLLVAATQLSHCRLRRFAPTDRWMAVAKSIFSFISGGAWKPPATSALWKPSVGASFDSETPLPADAERQAVLRGVQFYRNALLLPNAARAQELAMIIPTFPDYDLRMRQYARLAGPYETNVSGDGQLGVFEGLTSDIDIYGKQPQSNGVRCDCITETSASFAARAVITGNESDRDVSMNLLNYAHLHAGFHQPWAVGSGQVDPYTSKHTSEMRPWVVSGDAFGIMAWTTSDHAYQEFFSDDDARGLLGAVATAGLLHTERWHSTIATAVLGNLRATPQSGFAPGSAPFESMVDPTTFEAKSGWRKLYDSPGGAAYSPHYESYIWAVFLWAYDRCGYAPLLDRAVAGLTTMMEGYPTHWVPTANGIAMQRARIILPLAFLVRANDTALHRQWLTTAIDGLMSRYHCEGDWCAIKEELTNPAWPAAHSSAPQSNDAYGSGEAPLNQNNDDPVSDFLYTTNFALLGLHEAAAVLQNRTVQDAADKLASFVVRSQARSTEQPALDGAWMRAFDNKKWEAWSSDGDVGWGAWSVESGWTQSWITTTLGMRVLNVSLWELGQRLDIKRDFEQWIPVMFPPPPPPPPPEPCIPPMPCLEAHGNTTLFYTLQTADERLCAPAPGRNVSSVIYQGILCGAHGSKAIQWTSAHTLDPRPGLGPSACAWKFPPGSDYTGWCGSCVHDPFDNQLRLPTHVC